jgi:hypothetical protein
MVPNGVIGAISEDQKKSENSEHCEPVNFLKIYLSLQPGTVGGSTDTSSRKFIPLLQLKVQALPDIHQTRLIFMEDVF